MFLMSVAASADRRATSPGASAAGSAEFCDVARHLTSLLGLEERVSFEPGDALAMPYADEAFDGAYSMNVSMNIADKRALYREIHRVPKPVRAMRFLDPAQRPASAHRGP